MEDSPDATEPDTTEPDTTKPDTTEPDTTEPAERQINSVDATAHQPIVARVMARKSELEALLAAIPESDLKERGDIDLALSTITELMTGDLEHVPAVVAVDMNRWLERNKHLGERVKAQATSEV
ncbi:MAG: hypothetical protein M4D80_04845 [Myxococcota bacterium]|nr:hypothetical protein [Myxococcota bacterium]